MLDLNVGSSIIIYLIGRYNLDIRRGESIAIVGESGCGKSTLLKLMVGYLVPDGGEIRWNGYSMNLVDRGSIYARTGFLMQEAGLLSE